MNFHASLRRPRGGPVLRLARKTPDEARAGAFVFGHANRDHRYFPQYQPTAVRMHEPAEHEVTSEGFASQALVVVQHDAP